MSWLHSETGYQLLCNRDEKRSRLPAANPQIRSVDGAQYIAPFDGDFGGSWIAANEYGVTLALLNHNGASLRGTVSRGHLITAVAGSRSIEEVGQNVEKTDLQGFAGFRLVALETGSPCSLFEWDGQRLASSRDAEHRIPLTSSSFDTEGVEAKRLQEFSARTSEVRKIDTNVLLDFHLSHGRGTDTPSAYSTCMHRPDAHTVSFTWIDVSRTEVRFFYSPAAPCKWAPGETVGLARKVRSLAVCG